jgi:phosphoglycerol transferase MdoB-like AlkP superfamily enzyme
MAQGTSNASATGRINWRIVGWSIPVILLSIPFIAMRTNRGGFDWDETDFIFMGAMLLFVGLAFEGALRMSSSWSYRAAAAAGILGVFLLIWLNLAVGIIGSEDNPANLMFLGVIATFGLGALVARFRAPGMARACLATAFVQAGVGIVALAGNMGTDGHAWPRDVIVLTTFFTGLWLASAWLFRRA